METRARSLASDASLVSSCAEQFPTAGAFMSSGAAGPTVPMLDLLVGPMMVTDIESAVHGTDRRPRRHSLAAVLNSFAPRVSSAIHISGYRSPECALWFMSVSRLARPTRSARRVVVAGVGNPR